MSRREDIPHEMVGLVLEAFNDAQMGVTGMRNDVTAARVGRSVQRIQRRLRELCEELVALAAEDARAECRNIFVEFCSKRGIPIKAPSTALTPNGKAH